MRLTEHKLRTMHHILIGWQAYRETKYTGKIALHNPEIKFKESTKNTCLAYSTFKTRLKADFGQIWILEKQVSGLLETSYFV